MSGIMGLFGGTMRNAAEPALSRVYPEPFGSALRGGGVRTSPNRGGGQERPFGSAQDMLVEGNHEAFEVAAHSFDGLSDTPARGGLSRVSMSGASSDRMIGQRVPCGALRWLASTLELLKRGLRVFGEQRPEAALAQYQEQI